MNSPQCEYGSVVAADRLDHQLFDLDAHYHRLCLSIMRVPYRSGNPLLPGAVHRE